MTATLPQPSSPGRRSVLGMSSLLLITCAGTEADNPVAEPVDTTPCKSEAEYFTAPETSGTFSTLRQALTGAEQVPVWLECVEWELQQDQRLSLQVFNFRGGCAIAWEGGVRITDAGEAVIELENTNPGCAVAGCGNCIYDVRGSVALSEAQTNGSLPFSLERLPCNGSNGRSSDWTLPLSTEPTGMSCRLSDPYGAASAYYNGAGRDDQLYTECVAAGETPGAGSFDVVVEDCGPDLSCVEGRCLPECTDDSDCPLGGALTCQTGYCRLPSQ